MICKITDHGNVLRLSRSSLKMHFGEVSETKGRERITATKLARTMGLDYPGDSAKETDLMMVQLICLFEKHVRNCQCYY